MACLIFPSLCTILYGIALWARAPNLHFAHLPKGETWTKVSMFVNTYYGSFNLGICHIMCPLMSHGYICPNVGILAIFPTFRVLQGPKCVKWLSCASDPNQC